MAESASRSERAAAMDEKRRRIQELKERRAQRATSARTTTAATGNFDEYIDGLLAEQPAALETASNGTATNTAPVVVQNGGSATAKDTTTPDENETVVQQPALAPPPAPKVESFSISTQTIPEEFPEKEDILEEDDERESEKMPDTTTTSTNESSELERKTEKEEPKPLPTDEMAKTVASKPFSSFINTASKKVERVLGSPLLSDLLVDYTAPSTATDDAANTSSSASKFVQSQQAYECQPWTAGRDVTDIDWSTHHREWMLATYHHSAATNSSSSVPQPSTALSSSLTPRPGELQSDGLALIWSLAMPQRPEHVFTAGSPVTCGRHHATDPMLVVGGCESGQLVVWDVRAGRLPVQKSTLVAGSNSSNNKGHVYPIGAMEVIEGGAGLVTSSSDGRLNFWSLANLREPAESMQVGHSISSLAVSPESESLLVGDEHGFLYAVSSSTTPTGQRSGRRQAKQLSTVDDEGENHGHYGLVTSLAAKSAVKQGSRGTAAGTALSKGFVRGIPGLMLSTGVDWTVKLWAPAYSDRPLFSLVSHSYDYMSDVMWSPTHPSLFATASSNGTIGLWNLATSFEEPMTGTDGIAIGEGRGLNKLSWSLDGRRLAVAAADQVHVLSLSDDVVSRNKSADEESKVMHQLLSRGWIDRP